MLEIKDLRAAYGGVECLHGLSARIESGRLTAIIGPNGCGKSTLIKCLAGLMRPTAGEILLDGQALRSGRALARRVSYMPQARLVPDIPVRQLVMHGRYPHLSWGQRPGRGDREIVERALARTKLTDMANRSVLHLSGGERQRAYLAMMLAQEAPVMLLDEPTTYLDLSSQFLLMELLCELRAEGRTVIVVLHDLALALRYADEALLMRCGALVAQQSPEAIFARGALEDVFHVRVRRLSAGEYLFSPRDAGRA